MTDLEQIWTAAPGLALSREAVAEFVRICIKNSEYDLTSGGHGTSFVDVDELYGPNDGDDGLLSELLSVTTGIISHLAETEGYNTLGFIDGRRGPVGTVSLRTDLAREVGLDSVVLRPYKRLLSQAIKPFRIGADTRVLLITDVATTGRNIVEAAELLRRVGSRGCAALAIANREEGAAEYLSTLDIPLHYVVAPSYDTVR